jgi:hypothetical protein
VKIRLRGTEDESRLAAERLAQTPGLLILSVSEPYADTMPSPSAVTSSPLDHPVKCTFKVLLEPVLIRASALLSSQFRSTSYGRRAARRHPG